MTVADYSTISSLTPRVSENRPNSRFFFLKIPQEKTDPYRHFLIIIFLTQTALRHAEKSQKFFQKNFIYLYAD